MTRQPSNIDILNIGNDCNQSCRQCYYVEKNLTELNLNELILAKKIIQKYSKSSIFIYPKEIANNQNLFPLIKRVGQKSVLSNGLLLNDKILRSLKMSGVEEIKITLFANPKEQKFFNGNNNKQYKLILSNIKKSKRHHFKVTVNNVLSNKNINSINQLCHLCHKLRVDKIEFLRLKPLGHGQNLTKFLLNERDIKNIILKVENNKKLYPDLYLSFNLSFGPNFYGKSLIEAKAKVKKLSSFWTKSNYLCPAIGKNYWGLSVKTGKIYWCFFAMNEQMSQVGNYDVKKDKITIDNYPDLQPKNLLHKLKGNCAIKNCIYARICLGGCRSTAYLFAKLKGEKNPLHAGMDICLTKCYESLFKK